MTAVRAVQLTKVYGKTAAVDHLDLDVPTRGVFGLLGPNGAGKSTTLRMLLGLVRPTDGWFELLGRVRGDRDFHESLRKIGALIEGPALYTALTGRRNLEVHARYLTIRSPAARVDAVLAAVGLRDRADDRVRTYSLGMRQRLGIAIALLGEPELLILDEPTSGLDAAGIVDIRNMIRTLPEQGTSVVLSSHLLSEVEVICDHVAIMNAGRLIAAGETTSLMYKYGRRNRIRVTVVPEEHSAAVITLRHAGYDAGSSRRGAIDVETPPGVTGRHVVYALTQQGIYPDEVAPETVSLEEVFLSLTGERYSTADERGYGPPDDFDAGETPPDFVEYHGDTR